MIAHPAPIVHRRRVKKAAPAKKRTDCARFFLPCAGRIRFSKATAMREAPDMPFPFLPCRARRSRAAGVAPARWTTSFRIGHGAGILHGQRTPCAPSCRTGHGVLPAFSVSCSMHPSFAGRSRAFLNNPGSFHTHVPRTGTVRRPFRVRFSRPCARAYAAAVFFFTRPLAFSLFSGIMNAGMKFSRSVC